MLQRLKLFTESSGLQANNRKSTLYFSAIDEAKTNIIKQLLDLFERACL